LKCRLEAARCQIATLFESTNDLPVAEYQRGYARRAEPPG
jgi:hypothetical protein